MSIPQREAKRGWLRPISLVLFGTVGLPVVATAFLSGKVSAEKMLTLMTQPLFMAIVAALSIGMVLLQRDERRTGFLLICGACLLWILSSSVFVSSLVMSWESSIDSIDPSVDETFDFVIVLGGGTSVAPNGRPQFGNAGDRVGYAAKLYLNGIAKKLVTSGDNLKLIGALSGGFLQKDDPSEQTKQLWIGLGIPAESIFEIPGQNTSSEMAALKSHPEFWRNNRCAILTSAIHLPRAMQLARRAGITASPIAANYQSSNGPLTLINFMPEAEELLKLQFIIKEWIAMRIGR